MNADRWDRLFEQLEAAQTIDAEQVHIDTAEQVRAAEIWTLELVDRLRAQRGALLTVHLENGQIEAGVLLGADSEWVQLSKKKGHLMIAMRAIQAIGGLTAKHARTESENRTNATVQGVRSGKTEKDEALNRLNSIVGENSQTSFRHKLRALSNDRMEVLVTVGNLQYRGKLDQVALDHIDLWVSDKGDVSAVCSVNSAVSSVLAVPISRITSVLAVR